MGQQQRPRPRAKARLMQAGRIHGSRRLPTLTRAVFWRIARWAATMLSTTARAVLGSQTARAVLGSKTARAVLGKSLTARAVLGMPGSPVRGAGKDSCN